MKKEGLLKFIEARICYLAPIGGKTCPKCGYVLEKPIYSIERKALAQSIAKEIGSKSQRIEQVIYDILSDLEVTGNNKIDARKIVDEISAELLVRYLT